MPHTRHVLVGSLHVGVPVYAMLMQRRRIGQRHVRLLLRCRSQRRRRPLCPQLRNELVQQVHVAWVARVLLLRCRRLHERGRELCRERAWQLGSLTRRRMGVAAEPPSMAAPPVVQSPSLDVHRLCATPSLYRAKPTSKSRGTLQLRPCCRG